MATITSSGVGSGLDVNSLVTQLMAVEKQPLTALDTKEASYQAKISAYGTLKSSVFSLKSAADALKAESLYAKQTATSGDSTILTATANSVAKAGNYTVQVVALAQNQALASQDFSSTTTALSSDAGKIKIEIGTYSGSTFTADSTKTAVTIDIAAGDSSLASLRDQINAANAGITASIVNVDAAGTKYKLAITSNTTGAAGSLKITTMDSDSNVLTNNTGLAKLSYDPSKLSGTGNEYTVNAAAQDARIKVNGVDLYRNSNTIGDAITGVSLSALKEGTTTLKIAADTTSIRTALESFVKAYNDTIALGRQLSSYNTATKTASILTGETAARSIMSELRTMIGLDFTGTTGSIKRLSDLGIASQRDGTLQINTTKMLTALSSPTEVAATLSTNTTLFKGVAVQMSTRLGNLLADNGAFGSRLSGINSSIKDIDKRRTTLETRLTGIEKRYRTQFTTLDSLVASMQRTSQYLTQQLSSLSNSKSN
jgi:flagellar hook-associated protein 2